MNQYRCEHREMICHKNKPCGFQEYGDEESEVVFCSFRSIENEDKRTEREKVLDEVLQLPQRREQPNGSMYIYVNDVKALRQKAGEP